MTPLDLLQQISLICENLLKFLIPVGIFLTFATRKSMKIVCGRKNKNYKPIKKYIYRSNLLMMILNVLINIFYISAFVYAGYMLYFTYQIQNAMDVITNETYILAWGMIFFAQNVVLPLFSIVITCSFIRSILADIRILMYLIYKDQDPKAKQKEISVYDFKRFSLSDLSKINNNNMQFDHIEGFDHIQGFDHAQGFDHIQPKLNIGSKSSVFSVQKVNGKEVRNDFRNNDDFAYRPSSKTRSKEEKERQWEKDIHGE